jgi:cell fate (sporulation/competence/biofilm development) regulator YlbF (YheA/YmcA/DUF963 family)
MRHIIGDVLGLPRQSRETIVSEINELAGKLGKALSQSPQALALRAARAEMDKQPQIAQALQEYQNQADKIGQLDSEQKPIEVEDKKLLQQLRDKLVSFEIFKKFTAAQMEYVSLMHDVNETLRKALAETEKM